MKFHDFLAVVSIVLFLFAGTEAAEFLTIGENGNVSRIDFETGNVSYTTPANSSNFGGMSKSADGRFFTLQTIPLPSPLQSLIEINPRAGALTTVASLDLPKPPSYGSTLTLDGRLLTLSSSDFFLGELDKGALSLTNISLAFSHGGRPAFSQSLTTAPDGTIYSWINGVDPGSPPLVPFAGLFRIDLTSQLVTAVPSDRGLSLNPSFDFESIAFAPSGQLYGFTDSTSSGFLANSVYSIDTNNGATTYIKTIPALASVRGVEFLSIPEPNSVALLFSALLAVVPFRCRIR